MQKVLPFLGIPREKFVLISGIGCSSRFPYYMNTYGFHTIHGRAPAVATGLKIARPDLSVWVITGDGDGLSIGGNHLIHMLRRNLDIKILLFDNRIYGLTKGQYSPTSELGKKTKSSPMGTIDTPVHPLELALSAEATFIARAVDTDMPHLGEVLGRAARHSGSAFVHILQNCPVFNDGAFDSVRDRIQRMGKGIYLVHGQPLIFGKHNNKGIILDGLMPKIVQVTSANQDQLLIHDEQAEQPTLAFLLSRMIYSEFPLPLGVFRALNKPTYELALIRQGEEAKRQEGMANIQTLLEGPETWRVE
jgi:2-oxoglutarate ferredoxin oxidoreductase subunit beta